MKKTWRIVLPALLVGSFISFADTKDKREINDKAVTEEICPCEMEGMDLEEAYNRSMANAGVSQQVSKETPKYLNPNIPIEERIDDLLPRLTLEEKVIQLSDSWGSKGIARLKIPAMLKTEGLHGQSYATGSTIFPHGINMGSTFDTELIQEVGKATAIEAKAANLRVSWSPVLDVARDARWGRVEETYGEDPYLVGRIGVAWIKGFQGEHMFACPKHFAGHGQPVGGRDSHDYGLSDRVMRNIHLAPFRDVIKEANAFGVMAAYGLWNGVPDNGSKELLQKILREEWGFEGFVVSDCSGPENIQRKQSVVGTMEEVAAMAVRAGVDIECGSAYKKALASAVKKGIIKESELDANLRRVFRAKMRLGLFDRPSIENMVWNKLPEYDTPEHRALARKVAVKSTVLLKNENNLLPLDKNIKTIAVIGPNADQGQTGDYSAKYAPGQIISVLEGVKNHVSPSTKVLYAQGCTQLDMDTTGFAEAVNIAKQADAVILVVGDNSNRHENGNKKSTTGENVDGATLEIPGVQRQLIKAVEATGKPVVLVLVNGKPFTLTWEDENIESILETWYPGEEGGNATADIIFGDENPSGRLPISFPRHPGQLPLWYNYETSGRNYDYYDMPFTPLYRFGHGLSYTTFRYSNLKATTKSGDPGFVTVSVDIENTGKRPGEEVAQLYITDLVASVNTAVIDLKGFKRVFLKPGEKKTVTFELNPYLLSLLNPDMKRVLEAGKFRMHVGGVCPEPPKGSTEHKQKIGFKDPSQGISGEFTVDKDYKADFEYTVSAPKSVKGGESFKVVVKVKNSGNLLDIADVKLYGNSFLDDRRAEIEAGETKEMVFDVQMYASGNQTLTVILDDQIKSVPLKVSKVPAKLVLEGSSINMTEKGEMVYVAEARNVGSEPFNKSLDVKVEGVTIASQPLRLDAGASQRVEIKYAFPRSGTFRVKVGTEAEQQLIVPGGIGLALQDPLAYITFEGATDKEVKNEITGKMLPIQGKAQIINGKNGKGFKKDKKETFVDAGGMDLYRKPFTLAAWVYLNQMDNGQAMFFGGQAPMGADVDVTGTRLAAGIFQEKTILSYENSDVRGNNKLQSGKWIHYVYTYNPEKEEGAIYIDGRLDKKAFQKPFAGPLERIAGSQRFSSGKFIMDDVLVARTTMDEKAVKELYTNGVKAMRKAQKVTDWRPMDSAVEKMKAWAELNAGGKIQVFVEVADNSGKVTDSKSVQLKSGENEYSLAGLKKGDKVRLRIDLSSTAWDGVPALQTVVLEGASPIRWSTVEEWMKGSASNSLLIGL